MVSIHWPNGNWVVYNPSKKNWTILGSDKKTVKGHYSITSGTGKWLYNKYIRKNNNNSNSGNSGSSSSGGGNTSSGTSTSTDTTSTDTNTDTSTDSTSSTDTSTSDSNTETETTEKKLKGYKLNRLPKETREEIIQALKTQAKGNIVETTITDLDKLIQKEQPNYLKEREQKKKEKKEAEEKARKQAEEQKKKEANNKSKTTVKRSSKTTTNKTRRKTKTVKYNSKAVKQSAHAVRISNRYGGNLRGGTSTTSYQTSYRIPK